MMCVGMICKALGMAFVLGRFWISGALLMKLR